jgi:copper(I)-binding protein
MRLTLAGCVVVVFTIATTGCASFSGSSTPATPQTAGASASAGALSISKAYIPKPASPDVAVLYFTATNSGSLPITLTGIRTDGAAGAGFDHYVTTADGGQEMTALANVVIPAHGSVELSPDHDHVMLEQPKSLQQGQSTDVTIEVAGAAPLTFAVPVVAITGLDDMSGMTMGN